MNEQLENQAANRQLENQTANRQLETESWKSKLRTDSWKTKLRTDSWKTKHADKNEDRLRASHPCFAQAAISQAQEPNLCSMGEQLRTSTQEKQTCAICLQTIRKNAVWWHVTECKHYFHYDCWHS